MNVTDGRAFLSPILIGRATQLEYLRRRLSEEPASGTVIISGEAGIGKTRLVGEACAMAEGAGCEVLTASCFERDAALPYSLLIDLLRNHLLDRPPAELEALLGELGSELIKLVPELAVRCPAFVPTPPLDAEQEKRRLFHALGQLIVRLCQRRPLLIVFEDLHWADETTLDFLVHCCRQLTTARQPVRALLVVTYRPDDAQPTLLHCLAELDRLRLAGELHLEQLTRAETDVMVRAILQQHYPLRRDFMDELFSLTEGNPFFVEELLKAVHTAAPGSLEATAGDRLPRDLVVIPRTVKDAVTRRCRQLSPTAKKVLELAAVIGQRFDLGLLQAIGDAVGDVLIGVLKELVAAQLVVEESAEHFRFRHALTRESVYSGLLSTERHRLHRAIADALEAACGEQPDAVEAHLGDLAYHFYEAAVWPKAQLYCERAGRRARRLFAPGACVQHLSQALDAARRNGTPLAAVLRQRAGAYELLGEFNKALVDLEAALGAAEAAGDHDQEWEALIALGMLWLSKDYGRAGSYFDAALEFARNTADQRRIAHSLNRVGNWQMNVGDRPGALARHEQALSVFRELGDWEGMAATLDLLGMTSYHSLKLTEQRSYHRQAVALFRELGDRQGAISSLSLLALNSASYEWPAPAPDESEYATAIAAGEEALQESRRIGWRAGEAFACNALAMTLGFRGRYDRALLFGREGLSIAQEIGHAQWQVALLRALGEIELDLLLPERARVTLERGLALARETKSAFWTASLSAGLSRALLALGEVAAARELLEPLEGAQPLTLADWHMACARAALLLVTRSYEAVPDLVKRLERAVWPDGRCSRLTLLRVEALIGLKRLDAAQAMVELVLADCPAAPPLLRWRAQLLHGRVLAAQGRRREAAQTLRSARLTVEAVATGIEDAEIAQTFFARALSRLPHVRPVTAERSRAKERFGGLTEREREVASLIAAGCSNREIAAALFLSERTVAVHIANILAKLSFTSRAQIAAWATANGLARAN